MVLFQKLKEFVNVRIPISSKIKCFGNYLYFMEVNLIGPNYLSQTTPNINTYP